MRNTFEVYATFTILAVYVSLALYLCAYIIYTNFIGRTLIIALTGRRSAVGSATVTDATREKAYRKKK